VPTWVPISLYLLSSNTDVRNRGSFQGHHGSLPKAAAYSASTVIELQRLLLAVAFFTFDVKQKPT